MAYSSDIHVYIYSDTQPDYLTPAAHVLAGVMGKKFVIIAPFGLLVPFAGLNQCELHH